MKVRTKIYISQILLTLVISTVLLGVYALYKKHHNSDIDEYVKQVTELKEKEFLSSMIFMGSSINDRKETFRKIHKDARKLLREHKKNSLFDIKERLGKKNRLKNIDIELFLINKDLIIYDTTFERDLGFDLSLIPNSQYYIDKINRDDNIHFVDDISYDSLDNQYKQYSFSKVAQDKYLEVGFIDNSLNTKIGKIFFQNEKRKNKRICR